MDSCNLTDEQIEAIMERAGSIDETLTLQEVVDTLADYLPPWIYQVMSPSDLADYVIEIMYPWMR